VAETVCISVKKRTCFFVADPVDVPVDLLKWFFGPLSPEFVVPLFLGDA
jgi:hypothetical protein